MYKKLLKLAGVSSLAASLLLAGCGKDSSSASSTTKDKAAKTESDEKVTITFWDDNAGPQRTPIWEKIIKDFEAKNPNITVDYVGLPKDSSKSKYDTAIAANDTPDVAIVYPQWIPEFVMRGALLPLDSYFNKWDEKGKIDAGSIKFNKDIAPDKKLYAVSFSQNQDILWVRPDLFKAANVKIPETWDEFFTAAEKMTDPSKNVYGFTLRGGVGGSFQLQRMMYAYSGITDYMKNGKSTINDPKHVEFLKKYLGMYKKYTPQSDINADYKTMMATFGTGIAAMVQHNIGSYGENAKAFKPEQFQAIPLPASMKGNYVAEGGNTVGLGIFKGTKHADDAWKFIAFVNSKESQSYWNQQAGQIPTNSDTFGEDWVKQAPHIQTAANVYSNPKTKLYIPPFYLPEYSTILNTVVDPGVQEVLSGKKTVEQFLDEWANALNEAQKKYDEHMKK
ncbi:ABC transporter substrate-binding protein [Neobacillus dielmonensis]|uniref:ABC transporter substrate-binding protein n=1 Tax=Neobacillus dielmonensis TaxID=1347369 RepID=UPI0005A6AE51|nr:sugar ABC transporter substrate-binding protein [Neobacillus dielmonensis]